MSPTADPGRRPVPKPTVTAAGVIRDTAAILRRGHPAAASATALRIRSVHARELLVELSWPGQDAAGLDAWAVSGEPLPPEADALHLGHYARVLCLQDQLPQDRARGRAVLEALVANGYADEIHAHALQVLLQLRAADGDVAGCEALWGHRSIPPGVRQAIRADLANPFLRSTHAPPQPQEIEPWIDLVSQALLSPGLAPLRLDPTLGEHVFDQLTTEPLPLPEDQDGPLVTVVVSAYQPGPPLLTALRSLVAQTWTRLEILVVDDASPDRAATEQILTRAEDLDPRIRVIRKAVNGGTYRARNSALRQARGQFLTCLDSDDWLHPQALASLLGPLRQDTALMASIASAVRIPETLRLSRLGYPLKVVGAPTLMIRLDPVFGRLGFFDPTRKAADTEYARRIVAAFGNRSVHRIDDALLLLRSGETLSSAEFGPRWRHPSRHAYKNVYTPWHEEIRAGAPAYLDPGRAPLVDPLRWRTPRVPALARPVHYDLVVGGDWRRLGGPQRSMLEEIRAARQAGLRVGVLHLEALRFATQVDLPLCAPLIDLIRRREVDLVQLDDRIAVDTLLIRYPPVLQHPPHVPDGAFTAQQVLLVANQAPLEPDGSDQRYVVSQVSAHASQLFGREPWWVPQGPVIRRVLLDQDPGLRLTPQDNPGVIDPSRWRSPQRHPGADGAPIRVGRYSRDDLGKYPPTLTEFLAAYDLGPGYQVRLMGARRTWNRLVESAGNSSETHQTQTQASVSPSEISPPPQWEILPAGAEEPREFLADLDFFLYQDHPGRHEAFGRVLLEAAASGVVVIAHPRHRPVFGDLLDYAPAQQARELIADYVRDPQRYAARVHEMEQILGQEYSHDAFLRRVQTHFGRLPPGVRPEARVGQGTHGDGERVDSELREGQHVDQDVQPWAGRAQVEVHRTLDRHQPLQVDLTVQSGPPLGLCPFPVRAAADAQRADQVVLIHQDPLTVHTREALAQALEEPAEEAVLPAVLGVVDNRPDLVAAVVSQDGQVRVHRGSGADGVEFQGLGASC